jgi:hypothetical protein
VVGLDIGIEIPSHVLMTCVHVLKSRIGVPILFPILHGSTLAVSDLRMRCIRSAYWVVAACTACLWFCFASQAQPALPTNSLPITSPYKRPTSTNSYQPLPLKVAGTPDAPIFLTNAPVKPEPISDELRRRYRLNSFYTNGLMVAGVEIIGSSKVSDWAFLEAAYLLDHYLQDSPQWVREALTTNKVRLAILAVVEYTMDLPENRRMQDGAYQDRRSRGLGGMPQCSCGEENLLSLRGDPYGSSGRRSVGENITIHEFAHTLADAIGARQGRRGDFWTKLNQAFKEANATGGRLEVFNRSRQQDPVYASTTTQEYWAEGAQAWFDCANPSNSGGLSNRDDVKRKDPALAALLAEVYGDGSWRYVRTNAKGPDGKPLRSSKDLNHLAGLEEVRSQFPVFDFQKSPRIIEADRQQKSAPAS